MKFEVSAKLETNKDSPSVILLLQEHFQKVSDKVERVGDELVVKAIEASFGSINRKDFARITLSKKEYGYLCIADVTYKPSVAFWIILIITLFTWIFWLIPIIFYLIQKKTVREAIENTFKRVKDELE